MLNIVERSAVNKELITVNGIDAHVSKAGAEYLYTVSKRLGAGNYVELGCFYGGSALCIGQGIKDNNIDARLFTIDLFTGYKLPSWQRKSYSFDTVRTTFEEHGLSDIITTVQGASTEAASRYQDMEFNFLFIDADHGIGPCRRDFEAWSPLVRSGGEIAFHDNDRKGVSRCIENIPWERRTIGKLTIVTKP